MLTAKIQEKAKNKNHPEINSIYLPAYLIINNYEEDGILKWNHCILQTYL